MENIFWMFSIFLSFFLRMAIMLNIGRRNVSFSNRHTLLLIKHPNGCYNIFGLLVAENWRDRQRKFVLAPKFCIGNG